MGFIRLHSRVATNSFGTQNNRGYAPFYFAQRGDSFYNLSKPQYSHQTYYQLAYNGAGAGGRGERWLRANNVPATHFIPPNTSV